MRACIDDALQCFETAILVTSRRCGYDRLRASTSSYLCVGFVKTTMKRILITALMSMTLSEAAHGGEPLIVGHRGASYDAPENTLAAFRLAWEQGADGIEGDFHLTSDGQIVCIHDKDTERVAGVKHVVAETPLATLRQLDVGKWKDPKFAGERMPTLAEVLAIVPEGKMLFIELKVGVEIVPGVLEAIDASGIKPEQIVVISFDADAIAACERRRMGLRTHWLTDYKQQEDGAWRPTEETVAMNLRKSGADALGSKANPAVLDAKFLNNLAAADLDEFGVWTVDDPEVARFYIERGAWSITTNRPAWLRQQLAKPKP
jgi:glycerophosphoryl diester phosphodiesterase